MRYAYSGTLVRKDKGRTMVRLRDQARLAAGRLPETSRGSRCGTGREVMRTGYMTWQRKPRRTHSNAWNSQPPWRFALPVINLSFGASDASSTM